MATRPTLVSLFRSFIFPLNPRFLRVNFYMTGTSTHLPEQEEAQGRHAQASKKSGRPVEKIYLRVAPTAKAAYDDPAMFKRKQKLTTGYAGVPVVANSVTYLQACYRELLQNCDRYGKNPYNDIVRQIYNSRLKIIEMYDDQDVDEVERELGLGEQIEDMIISAEKELGLQKRLNEKSGRKLWDPLTQEEQEQLAEVKKHAMYGVGQNNELIDEMWYAEHEKDINKVWTEIDLELDDEQVMIDYTRDFYLLSVKPARDLAEQMPSSETMRKLKEVETEYFELLRILDNVEPHIQSLKELRSRSDALELLPLRLSEQFGKHPLLIERFEKIIRDQLLQMKHDSNNARDADDVSSAVNKQ